MKRLAFGADYLKIYSAKENPLLDGTKYIIQQVESGQTEKVEELLKMGFRFHERYLFVEANMKAAAKMREQVNAGLKEILLEVDRSYPEDMYELAYEAFGTDRRFHLEQQFDQDRAKYVKESYINWCRDSGMPVFSARKEDELLGYIIIDLNPDREGDIAGNSGGFQIMLGVTRPGIKGKTAALSLYNGLLNRLSLPENGGYTKYCGYISSTNIASINLHQHLGAKVIGVMDEYIYRTIGGK